jgi:hypothetical protein
MAVFVARASEAQDMWRKDGAPANDPNVASSGQFGVIQLATDDYQKLLRDWAQPDAAAHVSTVTTAKRNTPVYAFIIFRGCKADPSGACNVTVDYDAFRPDGGLYDHVGRAEVWVGKPAPPPTNIQLSAGGLGLLIENKDPLGVYTIRATVTDNVAGITLKTEQKIAVSAN